MGLSRLTPCSLQPRRFAIAPCAVGCKRGLCGAFSRAIWATVSTTLGNRDSKHFLEILLPYGCDRMCAVATSFRSQWENDSATLRNARNFMLENAQLRWINEIVGGIDGDQ